MKEIGILEFHFHIKYLNTTMRITKGKNTNVTVFTTEKILERIKTYTKDLSDFDFVLKRPDETVNQFLKRVERICNDKIDLLFINTIQTSLIDAPHYINFKPKSKTIITVHMLNHWFKANIGFNIRNLFRSIDATLSIHLIRKLLLPKFNAVNVIYKPMKVFLEENTDYKKPIFTIPFNFYDNTTKKVKAENNGKIRVVVPGLIEAYRRDYDLVIDVFEGLFNKYKDKVILDILGKPVGKAGWAIVDRCKMLKDKGYNIIFSEGFVPEKDYDERMRESDIIFSPLNVVTKRDTGITEKYGLSEGSALPFEAIQYCKPLIVPKEFKVIDELKTSALTYSDRSDLEKIFVDLIDNKKSISYLKKQAYINSGYFTIENLNKYFEEKILSKLNKL